MTSDRPRAWNSTFRIPSPDAPRKPGQQWNSTLTRRPRLVLVPPPREDAEVVRLPQRRSSLRPVSVKRQRENRERRAMAERRFPGMQPDCAVPGCPRPADDLHEILTRARGGSITDEENTIPVCRQHNGELTLEPDWGYDLNLLRHSWDGPPGGTA